MRFLKTLIMMHKWKSVLVTVAMHNREPIGYLLTLLSKGQYCELETTRQNLYRNCGRMFWISRFVIFGLKIHFWSFSQTVCLCLRLWIVRERIYLEFDLATMISIFSKLNAFKSGSNEVVLLHDSVLRRYVMLRFDFDVTKNFIELDRVHM